MRTENSNKQWFGCLVEFLQAIQRESASLCCNPSNHKLKLHAKCLIPVNQDLVSQAITLYPLTLLLNIKLSDFFHSQVATWFWVIPIWKVGTVHLYTYIYVSHIYCLNWKNANKKQLCMRGLRHPLGEIIMNEYE